jgi:hypothetical protein
VIIINGFKNLERRDHVDKWYTLKSDEPHTSRSRFHFCVGLVIGQTPARRKSKALTLADLPQLSSQASNGRYANQAYDVSRNFYFKKLDTPVG